MVTPVKQCLHPAPRDRMALSTSAGAWGVQPRSFMGITIWLLAIPLIS